MKISDASTAVLLLVVAGLLYGLGFFGLFKPEKAKAALFRKMEFFHEKGLALFYKQRKAIMSRPWYLTYLKALGIVLILLASLMVFLFVCKL